MALVMSLIDSLRAGIQDHHLSNDEIKDSDLTELSETELGQVKELFEGVIHDGRTTIEEGVFRRLEAKYSAKPGMPALFRRLSYVMTIAPESETLIPESAKTAEILLRGGLSRIDQVGYPIAQSLTTALRKGDFKLARALAGPWAKVELAHRSQISLLQGLLNGTITFMSVMKGEYHRYAMTVNGERVKEHIVNWNPHANYEDSQRAFRECQRILANGGATWSAPPPPPGATPKMVASSGEVEAIRDRMLEILALALQNDLGPDAISKIGDGLLLAQLLEGGPSDELRDLLRECEDLLGSGET